MTSRSRDKRKARVLAEVESTLADLYPTLHIIETDPLIIVRGVFPVHLEQNLVDRFFIQVTLRENYPKHTPEVREINGRIPRVLDRHVIPKTGELCLFLPEERWKAWRRDEGFAAFLTKPVNLYLLGQLYFEQHGRFPFGERGHGLIGVFEYYAEELETNDIRVLFRCLDYLSKKEIKGHWECYCGSGKRMRDCHWETILALRQNIPRDLAALRVAQIATLGEARPQAST